MRAFFTRAAGWFTDSRRAAVQALITSALTLLAALGQISGAQSAAVATFAASVLILVQGGIGLALLRASDAYTWFDTAGRAAIYGVAAALGPVGVAFQLWGPETTERFVALATVLASMLAAFVQVVNTQTLAPQPPDVVAEIADTAPEAFATFGGSLEAEAFTVPMTLDDRAWAEWVPPLAGLRVGVYAPNIGRGLLDTAAVREYLEPEHVGSVTQLCDFAEFHGLSLDLVLTTVPITRGLLAESEPSLFLSTVSEDRVRFIGS